MGQFIASVVDSWEIEQQKVRMTTGVSYNGVTPSYDPNYWYCIKGLRMFKRDPQLFSKNDETTMVQVLSRCRGARPVSKT